MTAESLLGIVGWAGQVATYLFLLLENKKLLAGGFRPSLTFEWDEDMFRRIEYPTHNFDNRLFGVH